MPYSSSANEGPNCPWSDQTYVEWAEDVLKFAGGGWAQITDDHGREIGLLLRGPCPRCLHHGIDVHLDADQPFSRLFAVNSFRKLRDGLQRLERRDYPAMKKVFCHCTAIHQGHPRTDEKGCGQWGDVRVVVRAASSEQVR